MKFISVILFCGWLVSATLLAEQLPVFEPDDLVKPSEQSLEVEVKEEKKLEDQKAIDYISFINQIIRLKRSSNKLRTEYDINKLSESALNQMFLFRDTLKVKRNVLVSGEMGCWFEPVPDIEVFVTFPKELTEQFFDLQEYDYITCYAKLVGYRGKMVFRVTEILSVEPFDPTADFLELNQKIDEIHKLRGEMEYLKFKDELNSFSLQHEGRLGIITGKMISLTRDQNTNEVIMQMDYGELPIEIVCHPDYLDVLLDLRFNSRISMAVIFDSMDPRKGYRFTRGCMVQLRDVNVAK